LWRHLKDLQIPNNNQEKRKKIEAVDLTASIFLVNLSVGATFEQRKQYKQYIHILGS
jgi:hypothetical protein